MSEVAAEASDDFIARINQYVMYVARNVVDLPEEVCVEGVENEGNTITYTVRVNQTDIGKVIGKQGRIANAIRTLVKATAMKEKRRVYVEIDVS